MQIHSYFLGYFLSIGLVILQIYREIPPWDEAIISLDIIYTQSCQLENAILFLW